MPELRKDPVLGRWVIISVERGKRPTDFITQTIKKKGGFCPFCAGNEYTTPQEIIAFRPQDSKPNGPGWRLRVIPNKFPALGIGGELRKRGEGIYDMMNGVGAHEVIVETPDHDVTLSKMPLKGVEEVLWAYYTRITDLKKDARLKYVLIFKNEGEVAGASLEHSHSQLIAMPIVPRTVKDEMQGARHHHGMKERCLFCDIVNQEINDGRRVVLENSDFIALSPFAPRAPFETWVLPKKHHSAFMPEHNSFAGLAEILQGVLKRMDAILNAPPYNFMLHTSPLSEEQNDYYHWHIEIMPKLSKVAGFEWGSGFYINPVPPEDAARFLREAKHQ